MKSWVIMLIIVAMRRMSREQRKVRQSNPALWTPAKFKLLVIMDSFLGLTPYIFRLIRTLYNTDTISGSNDLCNLRVSLFLGSCCISSLLKLIIIIAINFDLSDKRRHNTLIKNLSNVFHIFCILLKLLQIVSNFRNGHTGQLSFIMVLLLFLGAMARIFTTIQETGDKVMLVTFLFSTSLNATLVLQVLYYWNVKPDLKKKQA